jgi:hypothetical protein
VQAVFDNGQLTGNGTWSGREHFWIDATRRLLYAIPAFQCFHRLRASSIDCSANVGVNNCMITAGKCRTL